jgi:addiction module HigA family antidote
MPMSNPAHPGVILRAHMADRITISELAKRLGMTRANLSMILNGRLGISAVMAIKLSEAFPNSDEQFRLTLQNNYDLSKARRRRRLKVLPIFPKQLKKAA